MQRSQGARGAGLVAAFIAFTSSALMFAGSAPALAHTAKEPRQDGVRHFSLRLTGQDSVPRGDPDGQGSARLDLDPRQGTACYEISWTKLDGRVTAFHLHAGRRGSDGPHWIDFFNGKNFAGEQTVKDCVRDTPERIEAVIKEPSAYYLQVHSTAFESGAIRGQLG